MYDVIVGVSSVSHDLQAQEEYSDQWVKFNQQDKDSVKVCSVVVSVWWSVRDTHSTKSS